MTEYTKKLGEARVLMQMNGCRDSNLGNAITDAMVEAWDGDADMAFINNGGIRSVFVEGEITGEDIYNVLPFNNTFDRVRMTGNAIKSMLEKEIQKLRPNHKYRYCSFWQVSKGVQLRILIQSDGQSNQLLKIQVPCDRSLSIMHWCDLEDDKEYKVVVPSFQLKSFNSSSFTWMILHLRGKYRVAKLAGSV